MTKLLHGVPLHEWVGRMMKGQTNKDGRHAKARHTVKVIGFSPSGNLAEVHPSGHRKTEMVPISELLPWWGRNNDLRVKYQVSDDTELESVLDDVAMFSQRRRTSVNLGIGGDSIRREKEPPVASPQVSITAPVVVPEPQPEPVQTPIPPTTEKPFFTEPAKPAPSVAPMGIRRIVVDPNASDTWMEDLKDLKEAIGHKQAADQQVLIALKNAEEASELVKSYASTLDGKGVTIEWDKPETPPAPEPARRGPSRAKIENDIPEKDIPRVRDYRARLLKQMVMGRSYHEEDLVEILQADKGPTFTRMMTLTFKNHPRFHRVQGNRHHKTTYSLLS